MNDLRRPHARQPETDEDFVAQTQVCPVPARPDQLLERLGLGKPAGRARCLNLPVQPGNLAQWVVSAHQGFDHRWIGVALADAPPQKCARPGQPIANSVVGPERATPGQDGRLAQLSRMVYAGVVEEVRQLRLVLARRAGVRIPEGELPDDPSQLRGIVKL